MTSRLDMARLASARLGGGVALGAAVGLDVWATAALAGAMGTSNDLFPRWYGARAWLLDGLDPYSAVVSEGIRHSMGGAPGESLGAFVFGFVYPGYVALLLAPLALLPFPWAAALWLLMAQAATGAGAWLGWRAAGTERRSARVTSETPPNPGQGRDRARATPGLLVAFLFPASLLNLTFGQFAALVFLCLAGAWYLLVRPATLPGDRPVWDGRAGVLLALALVKPSVALLPVSALLLWAARQRRYRVVTACLLTWGVMVGLSLLALPGWPESFWRSTADYARVARATSAAALAADLLAGPPGLAGGFPVPALTVAVAAAAAAATAAGWRASSRRAGDALSAGVLLGAWLVPPLYEWNSVLLLVPLLTWLRRQPAGTPAAAEVDPWPAGVAAKTAALALASALTLPLIARWPSESRALWPSVVLLGWGAQGALASRGTRKVTRRSETSPSSAT